MKFKSLLLAFTMLGSVAPLSPANTVNEVVEVIDLNEDQNIIQNYKPWIIGGAVMFGLGIFAYCYPETVQACWNHTCNAIKGYFNTLAERAAEEAHNTFENPLEDPDQYAFEELMQVTQG